MAELWVCTESVTPVSIAVGLLHECALGNSVTFKTLKFMVGIGHAQPCIDRQIMYTKFGGDYVYCAALIVLLGKVYCVDLVLDV